MHKPLIRYLVSSPYGDVPADEDKLDFPLEGDPLKTPYRIYFQSIKDFLEQDELKPLLNAVNKKLEKETGLKDINEIIIRTEKHGLLYHPASIEIIIKEGKIKFGLNVAVTDIGKDWLQEEFSVLQKLYKQFRLTYLPEAHFISEINSMFIMLEEWFEGYHEFHITKDEGGKERLKLWEFGKGYTYLSPEQSFEIYKQASKILTLYYDFENFNYIYPWHHAAGDFVVKIECENNPLESPRPPFCKRGAGGDFKGGDLESPTLKNGDLGVFSGKKIDVRLTTARRYKPLMDFQKDTVNPLFALFYFFLHLSLQIRLDRIDGVGEVVWAEDSCVEATLKGFFDGLHQKEEFKNHPGQVKEFIALLQSFSLDELKLSLNPVLDLYGGTKDLPVILANLDNHAEKLHAAIQTLP